MMERGKKNLQQPNVVVKINYRRLLISTIVLN